MGHSTVDSALKQAGKMLSAKIASLRPSQSFTNLGPLLGRQSARFTRLEQIGSMKKKLVVIATALAVTTASAIAVAGPGFKGEVGQLEGAFVQGVLGVEELIQPPQRLPWDEAQHRHRHGEQSYHCRREDHLGG